MSREIDAKLTVLSPNLGLTLVASEDGASVSISLNYQKTCSSQWFTVTLVQWILYGSFGSILNLDSFNLEIKLTGSF